MAYLWRGRAWLSLLLSGAALVLLQLSPVPIALLSTVQQARLYSSEGNHVQAGMSFEKAALYEPWESEHLVLAIQQRLLVGDEPGAQRDLEWLAQLRPLRLDETLWLAAIYARQDRAVDSVALWDSARTAGVLDAGALKMLARDAIADQAWWQASAALEGLVKLMPRDAQPLRRLGLVQALNQPDEAVQTLAGAITIDPTLAAHLSALQMYLLDRASQPPDEAYATLGVIYISLNEYELAETALSRAYLYNPAYSESLAYLAYVRAKLGRPALGASQQALGLSPDNPLINYLVGLTWKEMGRPAEARAYFEHAHEIEPRNPAFAVEIAETYRDESAYDYAELWMKEAVRVAPGDIRFRIWLAQFYVDAGYKVEEEGLPLAEALVSEVPQNAQARDTVGWAYFLTGDLDRAFGEVSQALALDPGLVRAYVHMGTLLEARGQVAQAIQHYQHAAELDSHGLFGELARRALERLQSG